MQPSRFKDPYAAALGQGGGQTRPRSRWHPREAQERTQEITYLIKQALKDGRQLPLVCKGSGQRLGSARRGAPR